MEAISFLAYSVLNFISLELYICLKQNGGQKPMNLSCPESYDVIADNPNSGSQLIVHNYGCSQMLLALASDWSCQAPSLS